MLFLKFSLTSQNLNLPFNIHLQINNRERDIFDYIIQRVITWPKAWISQINLTARNNFNLVVCSTSRTAYAYRSQSMLSNKPCQNILILYAGIFASIFNFATQHEQGIVFSFAWFAEPVCLRLRSGQQQVVRRQVPVCQLFVQGGSHPRRSSSMQGMRSSSFVQGAGQLHWWVKRVCYRCRGDVAVGATSSVWWCDGGKLGHSVSWEREWRGDTLRVTRRVWWRRSVTGGSEESTGRDWTQRFVYGVMGLFGDMKHYESTQDRIWATDESVVEGWRAASWKVMET